jgi:hypothetical protein
MRLIRALCAHYKFIRRKRAFPEDLSPKGWTLLRMMLSQPDIIHPRLKGSILDLPRAVSFGKTSTGYIAQVPGSPGCFATGCTIKETLRNIKKAIESHRHALRP